MQKPICSIRGLIRRRLYSPHCNCDPRAEYCSCGWQGATWRCPYQLGIDDGQQSDISKRQELILARMQHPTLDGCCKRGATMRTCTMRQPVLKCSRFSQLVSRAFNSRNKPRNGPWSVAWQRRIYVKRSRRATLTVLSLRMFVRRQVPRF